jgi:hypothetical protein
MSSNSFYPNTFNNGQQQFMDSLNSRNYNTNTSHPLIQSSQEYMYYNKYVSIHSEDRDIKKYPMASHFEIELPEDLLNVASLRLVDWSFPANYDTFSILNSNITMTFNINNPYNPNTNGVTNILVVKTFECLFKSMDEEFVITIEQGFYNPQQMVTELTNKFNAAVTERLLQYFTKQSTSTNLDPNPVQNAILQQEYLQAIALLNANGGYTNFIIVYNNVSQKIWFGNICDGFILMNETQFFQNNADPSASCSLKNKTQFSQINIDNSVFCLVKSQQLPDYSNWGLPANLGLDRCNTNSISGSSLSDDNSSTYNGVIVPRFFYGDVTPGDNGYWLLPNPILVGSEVYWVECPYKINLMGPAYMYMEIEGQNCIDETSPYNYSTFTNTTNETNGTVNSSFAKIAIPTTPISQWFDRDSMPYKYYYPPAERMRKFNIKLRYHNGQLVDFGVFNYSFMIEFTLQMPQMLRNSKSVVYPPSMFNRR